MTSQDQIKQAIEQSQSNRTALVESFVKFQNESDEEAKKQLKADFNAKSEVFIHHLLTNFPAPDISTQEKINAYQEEFFKYSFGDGLSKEEWQKIIDSTFVYPPLVPLDVLPFVMLRVLLSRDKCRLIPTAIPSWLEVIDRYHSLLTGKVKPEEK